MEETRKKGGSSGQSSWKDLPRELLASLVDKLGSHIDVLRARAVCPSWRSAIPHPSSTNERSILSSLLPLVTPCQPKFYSKCSGSGEVSVLTAGAVYAVEPIIQDSDQLGWLLMVDELNPGRLVFRQPLFKSFYNRENEYDDDEAPYLPEVVNMLDFRVTEICKVYNLSCVSFCRKLGRFELPSDLQWSSFYDKVVLVSNLNSHSDPTSLDNCSVIVLFGGGKLAVLNLQEMQWKLIYDAKGFKFDDIINFEGKVYGISRSGKAYLIEYGTWEMKLVSSTVSGGKGRKKRLIESAGNLYSVVRCWYDTERTDHIYVYKLNEEENKWERVLSLGDQIFLIGDDVTFSVPAMHFAGHHCNSVFFTEDSFAPHNDDGVLDTYILGTPCSDDLMIGVFHMDSLSYVLRGVDDFVEQYARILWPPPQWFQKDLSLALNDSIEDAKFALTQIMANSREQITALDEAKGLFNPDHIHPCYTSCVFEIIRLCTLLKVDYDSVNRTLETGTKDVLKVKKWYQDMKEELRQLLAGSHRVFEGGQSSEDE